MDSPALSKAHRHLVLLPLGAWGHIRPLCALAARIVKARPAVFITFFATHAFYDRAHTEISRNFEAHSSNVEARARIRLVSLPEGGPDFAQVDALNAGFEAAYQELVHGRPVTCAKTSVQFPGIPSPDAAVFDIFTNSVLTSIRTHSKKTVKAYCWVVCSVAAYHAHFGVASSNKHGDAHAVVMEESKRNGKSVAEVAEQVFFSPPKGDILDVPGLPLIYDYEEYPQELLIEPRVVGPLRLAAAQVADGCDGLLLATPHAFETPETLASLSRYFNGEVHAVGPLLPTAAHASAVEKAQSHNAAEIDAFMERVMAARGPKSLVYVSFGSMFWSAQPEKIWAFVDVLLERNVPFLFSHASPFAQIPDEVKNKVQASGIGLLSPWSPQQSILAHPVTGWFVTHCGFNSVLESVNAGVPMICWPFYADQPFNALHVVYNLGIAYELLEVRTGPHGLRPVLRTRLSSEDPNTAAATAITSISTDTNGDAQTLAVTGTTAAVRAEAHRVLELAFGTDGAQKRANIERLRGAFAEAWAEGEGKGGAALERFLHGL